MIKCTKCSLPALIYQNYSNLHLCRTHFFDDVERKFKLTIRNDYKIKKNDKIIVAYSGGKDSSLALYLLNKFFGFRKDIEIIAVTIDEGISSYRNKSIINAKKFTTELNIQHNIYSFIDEYGITMDNLSSSKFFTLDNNKKPCSYCGVFRKKLLNKISKKLGGTKLVIGHNLDDEAQTILLNYLTGNINKMKYITNNIEKKDFIKRIKPLKKIPEQEVGLYSYLKKFPMELTSCPYSYGALRKEVRRLLNEFDLNHPGSKYALINGFETISKSLLGSIKLDNIFYCNICGEPCNGFICQSCKFLETFHKCSNTI